MTIKKRQSVERRAEKLADELADKPYGEIAESNNDEYVITSISITKSLLHKIEDLVTNNKRSNKEPKSVSALVRLALEDIIS